MKTSVALCSYNGGLYIDQQLRSIINQTQVVDEIVICDDGSNDNTISVIQAIQSETNINIRLFINETNLGCRANFQKALGLCKGDIIFLADQDDVWLPDKVAIIVNWFDSNKDKEVVFTNGVFIDTIGNPYAVGSTLFSAYGMTRKAMKWMDKGYSFELFLKNNKATGATMAIRRTFLKNFDLDCRNVNNVPYHDSQICIYAIQRNSLGYISDSLIKYRIHEKQDCGVNSIFDPMKTDNILSPLNDYMVLGQYLTDDKLIDKYNFLSNRREWVLSGTFFGVLKNTSQYFFFYKFIGALCLGWDLALCTKYHIKKVIQNHAK